MRDERVEEMQFLIKKLREIDGTLRKMRSSPLNYLLAEYKGMLQGFVHAVEFTSERLKEFKAVSDSVPLRHLEENFAAYQKKIEEYNQESGESLGFVLKKPEMKLAKVYNLKKEKRKRVGSIDRLPSQKITRPKLPPKSAEEPIQLQHFIEIEPPVHDLEDIKVIEENIHIIHELTSQIGEHVHNADGNINAIQAEVTVTKENAQKANEELAKAVSGKYSFIGWKIKWGTILGLSGAGVGTLVFPIIGTAIGGALGAIAGVGVGSTIETNIKNSAKKK